VNIDIGDLVKIKIASIGVPKGTVGLIIGGLVNRVDRDLILYEVQLPKNLGWPKHDENRKRYHSQELEVISESR
jgi:hypothetical protein